jgi:hypothetical protein
MSESPETDADTSAPDEDDVRQHSQDPAEGPDDQTRSKDDVPRVHTEEPAEG